MNIPDHFKIMKDHAVFRPVGQITVEKGVQLVMAAIAFARDHQIGKLMVVTTGFTGFAPPDLATRYFFFREGARVAQGKVSLALVVRAELIDHEKIGVTIAKNAGLRMDIFATEEEALAWLLSFK
jgi:hypothetical protein